MFTEKFYPNILKEVLYFEKKTEFINWGIDEDHRAGIRYAIAVAGLSEQQLVLINLKYGCDMNYKEAGDVVGISASKARSEIRNAIERIRMSSAYVYFSNGFTEGERMDHYIDCLIAKQKNISSEGGYEDHAEEIRELETRHLSRFGFPEKDILYLIGKGYTYISDIYNCARKSPEKWKKDARGLCDASGLFEEILRT